MDPNDETEIAEEDGEFAFETDHVALRGNKDYCELLKHIVKLECLKAKALQDIEELAESRNKALDDPITFIQQLKTGTLAFPARQTVPELPKIDWDKYGIDSNLDTEDSKDNLLEEINEQKVRGRTFTDSKPETFNQLWSVEEQKRLEELLEIYPEEQVESKRYRKIAEALGTRTPIQVMSRIQKYFAKLAKAGLPIPGRLPKGMGKEKNKASIFYKKSTFFPHLHVPVQMDDNDPEYENDVSDSKAGNKSIIDMLKVAKEQRVLDETAPVWQTKTMCVSCMKTGFLGARWTDNAGTDYCTDCYVKLLPVEKLTPIR